MRWLQLSSLIVSFLLLARTGADDVSHRYEIGELVPVWASTVGPYGNRQETYSYSTLPLCPSLFPLKRKPETLGEALQGMELMNLGMELAFRQDQKDVSLCAPYLVDKEDISLIRYAVSNDYWYEVFIDDLPTWSFIGTMNPNKSSEEGLTAPYLYTHRELEVAYNEDRIIGVDITPSSSITLDVASLRRNPVQLTYSVTWISTTTAFADRFDRYLDADFFEHKVHWYSIANAFLMALALTTAVGILLAKALRKDFARYDREEDLGELGRDTMEERGWKQVHGDVFRAPKHRIYLAGLLGTGRQLLVTVLSLILLTILGGLYEDRASILSSGIFLYTAFSPVGGYREGGKNWVRNVMITAGLWPGLCAAVILPVNVLAMLQGSARAIPLTTMLICALLWIPGAPWYLDHLPLFVACGALPFAAGFLELYYVLSSFWAYKVYYVYGFALLVGAVEVVMVGCVGISAVYAVLGAEDWRWQWVALGSGASAGGWAWIYTVWFFWHRTNISGLFQALWYFGYSALACTAFALILGGMSHLAGTLFVWRIYRSVKID
ncbi:transmembrane 9 superfamily member 3-like [Piptocephalis cylindrospora]|uniref:Transmembrane 9 superfamily member n=1 Tax=Piptocephalis cylindrospora TaxID=1907219 RepID=A0A4P9Y7A0_9FUNG|nr:transmembrane 9 superfamily member 3-like [Piptocephalis cylindrospora]|eukprot:RKP14997.1 transmembrane 9 superfamily member 3-like [Piptocephalis cylindrospora]